MAKLSYSINKTLQTYIFAVEIIQLYLLNVSTRNVSKIYPRPDNSTGCYFLVLFITFSGLDTFLGLASLVQQTPYWYLMTQNVLGCSSVDAAQFEESFDSIVISFGR